MSNVEQKTYRCRCGKKNPLLPASYTNTAPTHTCGCGRIATSIGGKITIQDRPKRKR